MAHPQPRFRELPYLIAGGFQKLAWTEWGAPDAEPLICVHGLTRNGRDFDALAIALADRFHVICPDLPGRGRSDWLTNSALYQPIQYVHVLAHLLAAVGRPVNFLGTSLGGICGMAIASMPKAPIMRLVLNDIGALIPEAALRRIATYLGNEPEFESVAALEAHLRYIHAPFGALTDAQWAHLAATSARALPDGRVAIHYDQAIADPVRATEPKDVDMWGLWEQIDVPTMLIRGRHSDLLLEETFDRMAPKCAATLVVADAGHAPALMDGPSIAAVRLFLETPLP
jgi:pimeloyl-ACP methyl ester carboxylesterase